MIDAVPLLPGYRWHRVARLWRTRGRRRAVHGSDEPLDAEARHARGRRRRRARCRTSWLDEVMAHFDQGTQRAILRLYRSSPRAKLAAAGRELGRAELPGARRLGRARPVHPAAFAEAYAAALGGPGEVLRLPDAGHWPWLDRPDLVETIVRLPVMRALPCARGSALPGAAPGSRHLAARRLRRARPRRARVPRRARRPGGLRDLGAGLVRGPPPARATASSFPLAAALLTPQVVAAACAVIAAWCFERLARGWWEDGAATASSAWFALGVVSTLVGGQLAFAAGLAPALGALLAAPRAAPVARRGARRADDADEPGRRGVPRAGVRRVVARRAAAPRARRSRPPRGRSCRAC